MNLTTVKKIHKCNCTLKCLQRCTLYLLSGFYYWANTNYMNKAHIKPVPCSAQLQFSCSTLISDDKDDSSTIHNTGMHLAKIVNLVTQSNNKQIFCVTYSRLYQGLDNRFIYYNYNLQNPSFKMLKILSIRLKKYVIWVWDKREGN